MRKLYHAFCIRLSGSKFRAFEERIRRDQHERSCSAQRVLCAEEASSCLDSAGNEMVDRDSILGAPLVDFSKTL